MRVGVLVIALVVVAALLGNAHGQPFTVALPCDKASDKLEELVKNPGAQDVARITELLGIAILISCQVPDGKVTCYQCLDKDEKLTAIQLLQEGATGKFKILGQGCPCSKEKK